METCLKRQRAGCLLYADAALPTWVDRTRHPKSWDVVPWWSCRQVGEFVPLQVDQQGKVIREVALARIALPLPDHPGQELEVRVALIRDWDRLVPSSEEEDRPLRWDEKPDGTHEHWLDERWQATPLPAPPMEPKLTPIVTTATEADAVELVQTYTRRWPAQENVIL